MNNIDVLSRSLNVYPAVFIVGAGASIEAGVPLVKDLANILWEVAESAPYFLNELKQLKVSDETDVKKIITVDYTSINSAFEKIVNYPVLVDMFKEKFKNLSLSKLSKRLPFHEGLAKLINSGQCICVVSFNWDNLIEHSWKRLYGTSISKYIIKPHGCVEDKESEWILPHEEGRISKEDLGRIEKYISGRTYQVVIVGYSERDEAITELLISPFEKAHSVFRVFPGSSDFDMNADDFMKRLVVEMNSETIKGWNRITFDNKQSIDYAFTCFGLDENHVDSCPKLIDIHYWVTRLKSIDYLDIVGVSGSGKSLTAFQIAREFIKIGYQIISYNQGKKYEIPNTNFPTLLIIDNAHNHKEFVNRVKKKVNSNLKLISVYTKMDEMNPNNVLSLSHKEAVQKIYKHYKNNRDLYEPILSRINDEIGYGLGKTSYESKLEIALKQDTPYLFNYVLSGQYNRMGEIYSTLELENYHMTVLIISMYQIVNTDKYINLSSLKKIVATSELITDAKVSDIKARLCDKNLLAYEQMHKYGMPHIQSSIKYLETFVRKSEKNQRIARELFHILLDLEYFTVDGISWFLNGLSTIYTHHKNKYYNFGFLSSDDLLGVLATLERNLEGYNVFGALARLYSLESTVSRIHSNKEAIVYRINNLLIDDAMSISNFINEVLNHRKDVECKEFYGYLQDNIDLEKLIAMFNDHSLREGFGIIAIIDRLLFYNKSKMIHRVKAELDFEKIADKFNTDNKYSILTTSKVIQLIYYGKQIDDLTSQFINKFTDYMVEYSDNNSFFGMWSLLSRGFEFLLLNSSPKTNSLSSDFNYLKFFLDKIDLRIVGNEVCEFDLSVVYSVRDFLEVLVKCDESRYDILVTEHINTTTIVSNMKKFWESDKVEELLISLRWTDKACEKSKGIVEKSKKYIKFNSPVICTSNPKVSIYLHENGLKLSLFDKSKYIALFSYYALESLIEVDKKFAKKIISLYILNINEIVNGIANNEKRYEYVRDEMIVEFKNHMDEVGDFYHQEFEEYYVMWMHKIAA